MLLRGLFRSWGCKSEIFAPASRVAPEMRRQAGDMEAYARGCDPRDAALLHLSIGSDVNDVFASLPCRKAILYHNVTPPGYFRLVNPVLARDLERGRRQARSLAGAAAVVMADSAFNAAELVAFGYAGVSVLPLVLSRERLADPGEAASRREFSDGHLNVLFVGRCAPNKRLEHALQTFLFFQESCGRPARFIHAGPYAGLERYHAMLTALARDLGLRNVVFTGPVTQARLNALYACADAFLCMSEHEGFCTPLLEAMGHDVPVLARAAGAVPETMDGAGVLFEEPRFPAVAEMLCRLCADRALRAAVIAKQRERIRRYMEIDPAAELRLRLRPLLE
ncbi:MAG: glycosyltransferase [Lentisphaerae bacterium]|nr:glycosyltransferase [Lentisphaerota bacterium]